MLLNTSLIYALGQSPSDPDRIAGLEVLLENLRQDLKIPAYSAAIVKDQKVVWAKGFGYADIENKIPATEHTSYHLASLTKTFGSTILMKLVQDGKVNLDDPVSKYGINLESNGLIKVRHLFSHTSEGNPGERYSYNGNRFAELDKVVQRASGKSFAELLIADILEPLGMNETAPNVPPLVRTKSTNPGCEVKGEVKRRVGDLIGYNSANADQIEKLLGGWQTGFPGCRLSYLLWRIQSKREQFRAGVKANIEVHDLDAAIYGERGSTFLSPGGYSRAAPREARSLSKSVRVEQAGRRLEACSPASIAAGERRHQRKTASAIRSRVQKSGSPYPQLDFQLHEKGRYPRGSVFRPD